MTPATQGPVPGYTSGLQRVSLNPSHFRSGRWLVLAEGVALSALGIAGIISSTAHRGGARALGLELAPWQAGMLLGLGLLAVVPALWRRVAVVLTAGAAVLFVVMLVISSVAAARGARSTGLDASDIVLYGVLAGLNFALLMWLIPDALEGPAWIPRRRHRPTNRTRRGITP
ncbi:MAG TPA: hypothetical protein VMU34_11235 [Mycobacterium sp.]|nr:hypothetical protein [Mycobacterium sp.]